MLKWFYGPLVQEVFMRSTEEILGLGVSALRSINEWDFEARDITPEEMDHLFRA